MSEVLKSELVDTSANAAPDKTLFFYGPPAAQILPALCCNFVTALKRKHPGWDETFYIDELFRRGTGKTTRPLAGCISIESDLRSTADMAREYPRLLLLMVSSALSVRHPTAQP